MDPAPPEALAWAEQLAAALARLGRYRSRPAPARSAGPEFAARASMRPHPSRSPLRLRIRATQAATKSRVRWAAGRPCPRDQRPQPAQLPASDVTRLDLQAPLVKPGGVVVVAELRGPLAQGRDTYNPLYGARGARKRVV